MYMRQLEPLDNVDEEFHVSLEGQDCVGSAALTIISERL